MIAKRQKITSNERKLASEAAGVFFTRLPQFHHSQKIACYFPTDVEFDTQSIIRSIWQAGKNCYLPLLKDDELVFALYQSNSNLKKNRYGILEPQSAEFFSAQELDLVILPLVGFDNKGTRLGSGKAYYDKTFRFLKKTKSKKPHLMGLAYECQFCATIPFDEWDIPLNSVLTEKRLISFALPNHTV